MIPFMAFSSPYNVVATRPGFPSPTFCTSMTPFHPKTYAAPRKRTIRAELPIEPPSKTTAVHKSEELVRRYWRLASNGKYSTTIPCFADDAVYHDGLYQKPFIGRKAILAHFNNLEKALPPNLLFVLDDVTASAKRAGARWHVETQGGVQLPMSRGLSMYDIVETNGELRITEAWEFGETPLKLPSLILPLLRFAGSLLQLRGTMKPKNDD